MPNPKDEKEELIKELFNYCDKHPLNKGYEGSELDENKREIFGVFADFILSRQHTKIKEVLERVRNPLEHCGHDMTVHPDYYSELLCRIRKALSIISQIEEES